MAEKKYIDCEALKRDLLDRGFYPVIVKNAIESAPDADVAEVRHGHWNTTDTILGRCCECSVCGSCPTMEYRYCPYCGAKMDLECEKDG